MVYGRNRLSDHSYSDTFREYSRIDETTTYPMSDGSEPLTHAQNRQATLEHIEKEEQGLKHDLKIGGIIVAGSAIAVGLTGLATVLHQRRKQ